MNERREDFAQTSVHEPAHVIVVHRLIAMHDDDRVLDIGGNR